MVSHPAAGELDPPLSPFHQGHAFQPFAMSIFPPTSADHIHPFQSHPDPVGIFSSESTHQKMCFFLLAQCSFRPYVCFPFRVGKKESFIIFISVLHSNYCERPSKNSKERVRAKRSLCQLTASERENLQLQRWRVGVTHRAPLGPSSKKQLYHCLAEKKLMIRLQSELKG